jgi:ABC-type sugar transport system ATPase subunit
VEDKLAVESKKIILEGRNIKKHFGGVQALCGIDFELYEGEVLAIVGDNGAGKSTLIKILSGVYKKDEGEIFYFGKTYIMFFEISDPGYPQRTRQFVPLAVAL